METRFAKTTSMVLYNGWWSYKVQALAILQKMQGKDTSYSYRIHGTRYKIQGTRYKMQDTTLPLHYSSTRYIGRYNTLSDAVSERLELHLEGCRWRGGVEGLLRGAVVG